MKLLFVSLAVAQHGQPLALNTVSDRGSSVLASLRSLLPALKHLSATDAKPVVISLEDGLHVGVHLVESPQIHLHFPELKNLITRVVDVSPSLNDRYLVLDALRLTQVFLASFNAADPDDVKDLQHLVGNRNKSKSAASCRRQYRKSLKLNVLGRQVSLDIPGISFLAAEPDEVEYSAEIVSWLAYGKSLEISRVKQVAEGNATVPIHPLTNLGVELLSSIPLLSIAARLGVALVSRQRVILRGRRVMDIRNKSIVGLIASSIEFSV